MQFIDGKIYYVEELDQSDSIIEVNPNSIKGIEKKRIFQNEEKILNFKVKYLYADIMAEDPELQMVVFDIKKKQIRLETKDGNFSVVSQDP